MDDTGENTSWADNMFQKLEDLCMEVDVAVREEIRSVENHLQTIGGNVINFYRDMVLNEPRQASDDVVAEERADDSANILVSHGSKLRINEVHHKETKKEVAHDIGYLVSYTSDTEEEEDDASETIYDEDCSKEDTEEEEDDASETSKDADCTKEDTEEEEDDASETSNDEDCAKEDIEEETDDISEIDTDECASKKDSEDETDDISEIDTDECTSEEDSEEEAYKSKEDTEPESLYYNFLVSNSSKAVFYEHRRELRPEFVKLICSALAEPIDEDQYDSSSQQSDDTEGCEITNASPPSAKSIIEAIMKLDKEIIHSSEYSELDENMDMPDASQFEMPMKNEEEGMLGLRRNKAIKLSGVTAETPDDEFCDSEWEIV